MILGIGIDLVDIVRFNEWHAKPRHELKRLFSDAEIEYALENTTLSAERFAARFAAKEAFYKALSMWQQGDILPLTTICNAVSVAKTKEHLPYLAVDWHKLNAPFEPTCMITLTHSDSTACAQVMLIDQ